MLQWMNNTSMVRRSQYPVESGATISDNIYNEPIHLSIRGVISNHPLTDSPNMYRVTSAQSSGAQYPDIVHEAFYYLLRLRNERKLVSILTALDSYENMAMTNITFPQNAQIGDSLQFSAEFVQVRLVESKTVPSTYLKKKLGSNKQGVPKANQGKQTPAEADGTKQSLAYKWAKDTFNLIKPMVTKDLP